MISEKRGQILAENEANTTMNATKNETKDATVAANATANATSNATSNTTANTTATATTPKEGRYERFVKKLKQDQLDAKTLEEHSSNATAVAGPTPISTNGTKKRDVELTIVQDFHQVKSVSNSTGEEPKKEVKKEGSHSWW